MKKQILTELEKWGCEVEITMHRMGDDEEFYIECLKEVLEDPYFEELHAAIQEKDTVRAFRAAHTLKGVLANVGLTPVYQQVVEIVEPLRAGNDQNLTEQYTQLMQMMEHLRKILLSD